MLPAVVFHGITCCVALLYALFCRPSAADYYSERTSEWHKGRW